MTDSRDFLQGGTAAHIPLVRAKGLIIDALSDFDHALGVRVAGILHDERRMNLREVPVGEALMMRVRPAGLLPEHAMSLDDSNLSAGAVARLRQFYPDDANERGESSIIDYEYDGTMNGVIYLAHELGHALADDFQREAGLTYRDNPSNIAEVQAYAVQNLVYERLMTHADQDIAEMARLNFGREMSEFTAAICGTELDALAQGNRPLEFLTARGLLETSASPQHMLAGLMGRHGAPSLDSVLHEAGIESMAEFLRPLLAPASPSAPQAPRDAPAPVPRNAGLTT